MNILHVVGARPNLMKIAPLIRAIQCFSEFEQTLLHTGQHYDDKMSWIFFRELGIPEPDIYLGVGSGSHAAQTSAIMMQFEDVLLRDRPDLVIVVGDVNSTLACTITAAKLQVPVAHIEAGLRSFDRTMPEEINRIVTDTLASILFTTSQDANLNLKREGIVPDRIHFVGNLMIDTLMKHRDQAQRLDTAAKYGLTPGGYALVTLHRPRNVDNSTVLAALLDTFAKIAEQIPILFPVHPRTMQRIREFSYDNRLLSIANLIAAEPQGYLAFLDLMMHARMVLTDSGGIQEETTILGVPCLTLRENTERPVTVTEGTNKLVGTNRKQILAAVQNLLSEKEGKQQVPELWDGQTARRIVQILRVATL